ncbi:MAG: class I SAM-dependent methyltransferase [Candidatus Hodarchaeales archaeon]|jgi:ubiquinone/menaquinone biosynthesis C-methylase UbiE
MGRLKAWFTLLTKLGPIGNVGKRFEKVNRFLILHSLGNDGFFDFLKIPKTFQEIIDGMGYKDSDYLKEVLNTLIQDKELVVTYDEIAQKYVKHSQFNLPALKDLLSVSDFERIYNAARVPKDFAKQLPKRLKGEKVTFADRLDDVGPHLFDYDEALTNKLYSALRKVCFAYTPPKKVKGETLLDIGCGAGRETAELWIMFQGKKKISAIDAVASFIETARNEFAEILMEISRTTMKGVLYPELTTENYPEFKAMRAEKLDFEDNSFDAIFFQQILHWTSDPRNAVLEMGRVLKPGGIIIGNQGTLPVDTPYMQLNIRVHEEVTGFFPYDSFLQWMKEANLVDYTQTTLAGVFRAYKSTD